MSRSLSLAMTSYLSGPLLALCTCLKVTRIDTLVFGFTSLDQDITISGVTYEAGTSVDASELRQSVGAGVDNLDIVSLITSSRITEVDIRAGLWDGARVELFFVNFEDTSMGTIPLLTGYLGEVSHDVGQYHAEIRSLSQRLSSQVGELTSPLCRVRQLFDTRCMPVGVNEDGVNNGIYTPASFRFTRTVTQVDSLFTIRFGSEPAGSSYYDHGRIRFLSGLNNGLEQEIKTHTITSPSIAIITLHEPFPFQISIGDSALLEAGCDRTLSTCHVKFSNVGNYQAEPYLIGNDALIKRGRR
jgi:uncharacterized phage protein (TIGR02218 family)